MATKKELRSIDTRKDYILSSLCYSVFDQLSIICSYMQKETPYGEEYEAAYKQFNKVRNEMDKLVDKLADTVDLRFKDKEEK